MLHVPRAAFAVLLVLPALLALAPAAAAKPRLQAPSSAAVGHGFTVKGSGFAKRSTVTLSVGLPESDAEFVARVRTDARGRFRSVQRFAASGTWVWVASGRRASGATRSVTVTRRMKVRSGVEIWFTPRLGVTAGTPFQIHSRGWGNRRVRFQAKGPGSKRWRTVGSTMGEPGITSWGLLPDNPVFNPRTRAGDWTIRACTSSCREKRPATRMAWATYRIGEP
ncbi:MAG: hypothetical protein ITG02_11360 [Patulibacter sp.]|nr:hypothetical protein [Patulibacter sp.]